MKDKPVSIDEVKDWKFEEELCGHYGGGFSKSLKVIVQPGFEPTYQVWSYTDLVLQHNIIDTALAVYNDIESDFDRRPGH